MNLVVGLKTLLRLKHASLTSGAKKSFTTAHTNILISFYFVEIRYLKSQKKFTGNQMCYKAKLRGKGPVVFTKLAARMHEKEREREEKPVYEGVKVFFKLHVVK